MRSSICLQHSAESYLQSRQVVLLESEIVLTLVLSRPVGLLDSEIVQTLAIIAKLCRYYSTFTQFLFATVQHFPRWAFSK